MLVDAAVRRDRIAACSAMMWVVVLAIVAVPRSAYAASPPGWTNPRALELAKEAIEAKKAGNTLLCIEKDQASLALEDHPYVKLHLSGCLAASGKLVEGLNRARDALASALRTSDENLQHAAQQRVVELLPRIAHVQFKLPSEPLGIKITFDNVPVRPALFKERSAVDPGDHVVVAERTENGEKTRFEEHLTLTDGQDRTIDIILKPQNLTDVERACAEAATTYEEKIACFERKSPKPNVHVALDASAYTDTTAVHVFSPAINASVASPTAGWRASGSYLIDVLSAASPDIVSMASPAYRETRHAASLSGGYAIGLVKLDTSGHVSSEPDYLSRGVGGAAAIELNEKMITPRVGYDFSGDVIGIRNTSFDVFSRHLTTHTIEAGVTFVLSKDTLLVTGISVGLERGEQSKLYRYVPFFEPRDAGNVHRGQPIDEVNNFRLPIRPREVVPRERDRYAASGRLNHRLSSGTLRVEERLYRDTWQITASTTDAVYLHDLGDYLRVWPHLRYHVQSGANFYKLAYKPLAGDASAGFTLPAFRTTDREWSQMMTVSVGGGARIALTAEKKAPVRYAVILQGEVAYSYYFESLFIKTKTAVYGTVGFEVEL